MKMEDKITALLEKNAVDGVKIMGVYPRYDQNKTSVTYLRNGCKESIEVHFPAHYFSNQIAYSIFVAICDRENIAYVEEFDNIDDLVEVID